MAITWKNIDAPNAGIAALGRTGVAAIGQGTQGLSKAFNDIGDRDRERRTGNALSQIAGIEGLDNFDEQKARILDSLGINTDCKAVTEALIGRRQDLSGLLTDKLSREADQLDIKQSNFDLSRNPILAGQEDASHAANLKKLEAARLASIANTGASNATAQNSRFDLGQKQTKLLNTRALGAIREASTVDGVVDMSLYRTKLDAYNADENNTPIDTVTSNAALDALKIETGADVKEAAATEKATYKRDRIRELEGLKENELIEIDATDGVMSGADIKEFVYANSDSGFLGVFDGDRGRGVEDLSNVINIQGIPKEQAQALFLNSKGEWGGYDRKTFKGLVEQYFQAIPEGRRQRTIKSFDSVINKYK